VTGWDLQGLPGWVVIYQEKQVLYFPREALRMMTVPLTAPPESEPDDE
jgi:hypothetical protein